MDKGVKMSEIKNTILHPENQPDIHLYPKTSTDQVEGLQEFVERYSSDSIKVSINVPKGASNGNITDEQLTILQKSDLNYIEMINDKELYYLNDNGHEDDYLTYSHVGIENNKATIKTLTITVSAKSFVIVTTAVPTESGGGKLYKHYTSLVASVGAAILHLYVYSISPISKAYNDVSVIPLYFISGIYQDPSNYFVIMEIIRNDTKLKVYYLSASNGRLEIEQSFNILTDNLTEL